MGTIDFDLAWKESKCLYFTADNEEEYLKAKSTDWKAVFGGDAKLSLEDFIETRKEI